MEKIIKGTVLLCFHKIIPVLSLDTFLSHKYMVTAWQFLKPMILIRQDYLFDVIKRLSHQIILNLVRLCNAKVQQEFVFFEFDETSKIVPLTNYNSVVI